jgi:N-ethylmaleimide reductase
MTDSITPTPSVSNELANLLEPFALNDTIELANRIVMAPMTRCMADNELVPTSDMAAYYARRADAGLIITEATIVRPDGQGYPNTPGIYTDAQEEGWRPVTDLVHTRGGKIFLQLWHVGRVSHPFYLDGMQPVSASAVALEGPVKRAPGLEYGTPRALELAEIPTYVAAYAEGAARALRAGFDGVEIHGANGYLIDQFLHGTSNLRTDKYGGSIENRARFVLEVVDAVVDAVGADRTGIRLSPGAYHHMTAAPDDPKVFQHLLGELDRRQIAYVHTGIFDDSMQFNYLGGSATSFLRRHYPGTVIGCGSYTPASGSASIANGEFDLLAIGRPFIANADLVSRIREGEQLQTYDERMLAKLE